MDFASFYLFIYLFLVIVVTFVERNRYADSKARIGGTDNEMGKLLLLSVAMSLFFGLRPHSYVFVDTMNYVLGYENNEGLMFVFDPNAENFIFDNLFSFFASERLGITSFFVLIAIIYFGSVAIAMKRLFTNDACAAFVVFLAAFSTFSYGTNGVKAGAAASLFLLALSYRNKLPICILLMIATVGMHHSMKMPVAAFAITLFLKRPKYYFYGWAFCAVMAAAHVSFFQNIFAGFADKSGADYLGANGITENSYISGFRPDFMLYSAMPVWIGYVAKFKKNIQSKMYDTLLYTYITTNAIWMLCMYASFTNRIAYLSWCMYPIVLVYPFLKENWGANKYRMFAKVMGWHLAFTVFMEMIYYGGLMRLFS